MIARLLIGLLADVVFESAASLHRQMPAAFDRYLENRGFVATTTASRTTAPSSTR